MLLLGRAIAFAAEAHQHQLDKAGHPYILHPIRVMLRLLENKYPEEVVIAGILHDVIEDSSYAQRADIVNNLIEREFGKKVLEIVTSVTRQPGETYSDFITRVAAHPEGRTVKLFDINDNFNRLHQLPIEARATLRNRYMKALEILAEPRKESNAN